MFLSVHQGAIRFPLLEIQPMDSHCSNLSPVTEELGEECFLLKINAGRLAMKNFSAFHCQIRRLHLALSFRLQALPAVGCCPPTQRPGQVSASHGAIPLAFSGP